MNTARFCPQSGRTSIITTCLAASAALAGLLTAAPRAHAITRYVNTALASGANNGTSWADAYQGPGGLATAITAAVAGDQVWVVQGSYRPTLTTTRTISFNLKTGVAIYGGFTGVETLLSERNFSANITLLTGDLLGNDGPPGTFTNNTDNSYHVVNGASASATAFLDGFTITGGFANGATASDQDKGGGAIFLSASNGTIRNCRFEYNRCTFGGGAFYIRQSSPAFADVTCLGNIGGSFGGACDMATSSNPTFQRCSFISNSAARAGGVEIFGSSNPNLANCLFRMNQATGTDGGGALQILSSSAPILTNCTIVSNSATVTIGGVRISSSTPSLRNCIVWQNTGPGGTTVGQQISGTTPTVTYCAVMDGFTGTGNISSNPLFVNMAGGDLRLTATSPCIDAANTSVVVGTLDLDGNTRVVDIPSVPNTGVGTVDMGAYEFQLPSCAADLDCDGDRDFDDVAAFALALVDSAAYEMAHQGCDIDQADLDGVPGINGNDVTPFVVLMIGSACP